MSTNIVPLNNDVHANLKVKNELRADLIAKEQVVPLVVHEFAHASGNYPVIFVKNSETGQFQAVALLGLEAGENLFVKEGRWQATHVPGVINNYPFKLVAHSEDENQFMLALDHDSDLVGEEGEALFDADKKETPYLERRREAIVQYFESGHVTTAFTALLVELDLLVARNLKLNVNDQEINLDGLYFVDEQKLNALSDEDFSTLRTRGFLPLIYAHMLSVHQIQRLAKMRMERS